METEADLEELVRGVVAQVVGNGGRSPATEASEASGPLLRLPVQPQPRSATAPPPTEAPGAGVIRVAATGEHGLFATVDDAVAAARKAQQRLAEEGFEKRRAYVDAMRRAGVANAERLARSAYDETRLGRFRDKVDKNVFAATRTLGVEDLEPRVFAGDHGLAVEDYLPWGVVASITPINSPSAFIINHAITKIGRAHV